MAGAVPIWAKLPGLPLTSGARSILNPVSLVELSVQLRLIWLEEAAVAERVPGSLIVCIAVVVVVSSAEMLLYAVAGSSISITI